MHEAYLVWATPNAEELVTYMARVSAPKNQLNTETAPKLLRYLIKHKHWSPYEMVNMCVEIKTTRAISAQILRHRSFSYQEFSTRYANTGELGSPIVPELRRQDVKNRQNSINDLPEELIQDYDNRISDLFNQAEDLYSEMVNNGVAKECARNILPLATQTKMYMNGSLRSFIHYIQVRTDPSTQIEHRLIALQIKEIFCKQFPVIGEAAFGDEN